MKECEIFQELLSRLLDGELSGEERRRLEEHLNVCPECREMYRAFSAVSEALASDLEEVPAQLHEKIMDGVRAAPAPVRKRGVLVRLRPYAAAACFVVILSAVLALGRDGRDAESTAADTAAAFTLAAPTGEDEESEAVPEAALFTMDQGNGGAKAAEDSLDGASEDTVENVRVQPDLALESRSSGAYAPGDTILRAWRLFEEPGADKTIPVEDTEALTRALSPAPGNGTEAELPRLCDCLLDVETEYGVSTLKLYFLESGVAVATESGEVYPASGTAEEFLALCRGGE